MNDAKPVCLEAKFKDEFENSLKLYSDFLQKDPKRGASFFAVCRGKLSEGFDFSDNAARCVVIVGIPYPPMMDPKVILKQCYLNEKKDNLKFNGQIWYNTEAIRAVNQAIGRVIRHKNDFGAIFELGFFEFSSLD
uniref:ATP-dependent helicase C-terminal domain-containing protein n=1 Tax=Romanomermis culicivorax TaxID=13658 RepID=A0A915HRT0_ROMCU